MPKNWVFPATRQGMIQPAEEAMAPNLEPLLAEAVAEPEPVAAAVG